MKNTQSKPALEPILEPEDNRSSDTHNGNGEAPLVDPFDQYDPANLRIDQEALKRGLTRKLLTTVPVRKPSKQDFIRVCPDPEYRVTAALIELRDQRESYLVMPGFTHQLVDGEYFVAELFLCINRQKVLSLWPVRLPTPDGRENQWHKSAAYAAEKAMTDWLRVVPNMSLGGYEIFLSEAKLPDPEWPTMPFKELLRIGFKDRLIENDDHPVIQMLQGKI